MSRKHRDRSWPPADAVAPLAAPVVDNHAHLPVPGLPVEGPGSRPAQRRRAGLPGRRRRVTGIVLRARPRPGKGGIESARALPGVRVALALHPQRGRAPCGGARDRPRRTGPAARPHHGEPLDEGHGPARGARALQPRCRRRRRRDRARLLPHRGARRRRAQRQEAFRAHIAGQGDGAPAADPRPRRPRGLRAGAAADGGFPERTVFHCFGSGPARSSLRRARLVRLRRRPS